MLKNRLRNILMGAAVLFAVTGGMGKVQAVAPDSIDIALESVFIETTDVAVEELTLDTLQSGSLNTVYYGEEEIDVLQGEVWESALKQKLLDGYKGLLNEIDIEDLNITCTQANVNRIKQLAAQVIDENPNMVYVKSSIGYSYYVNGCIISLMLRYDSTFVQQGANGNTLNTEMVSAYMSAVNDALAVVSDSMSPVEKLLAIYDYVMIHCEYDYQNYLNDTIPDLAFTAYGVLVNKSAVCQGYALAIAELCKKVGIDCYVMSSEEIDHAWNMVLIDGNWYHIDVTWDDPAWDVLGGARHYNFLKSDAEITELGHSGWKNGYFTTEPPVADKSNSYADYIFRQNVESSFWYEGGKWNYIKKNAGETKGNVVASTVSGTQAVTYSGLGEFSFLQLENGAIYLANEDGVYTTSTLNATELEKIWIPLYHSQYYNYKVKQFAVDHSKLTFKIASESSSDVQKLSLLSTARETALAPTMKVVEGSYSKNVKWYGTSVYAPNLKLTLNYSDGTQITLPPVNTYIYGEFQDKGMTEGTVYHLGLEAKVKLSVDPDWNFTDIYADSSNWIYNATKYVTEKGFMTGVGNSTFAPDNKLQRCMLVQILYSMEGKPTMTYEDAFSDVTGGQWYTSAVLWAYRNGVVSGYDNGEFGVSYNITREQLALMLYKYAQYKGRDVSGRKDLSVYEDANAISAWAREAMRWAGYEGIINGKSATKLDPKGEATRAEAAAMIRKFDQSN